MSAQQAGGSPGVAGSKRGRVEDAFAREQRFFGFHPAKFLDDVVHMVRARAFFLLHRVRWWRSILCVCVCVCVCVCEMVFASTHR